MLGKMKGTFYEFTSHRIFLLFHPFHLLSDGEFLLYQKVYNCMKELGPLSVKQNNGIFYGLWIKFFFILEVLLLIG